MRRDAAPATGRFVLAGASKSGGLLYIRCFFGTKAADLARIRRPDARRTGFDVAAAAVEASSRPGF